VNVVEPSMAATLQIAPSPSLPRMSRNQRPLQKSSAAPICPP
jgi:hypothetical protein